MVGFAGADCFTGCFFNFISCAMANFRNRDVRAKILVPDWVAGGTVLDSSFFFKLSSKEEFRCTVILVYFLGANSAIVVVSGEF